MRQTFLSVHSTNKHTHNDHIAMFIHMSGEECQNFGSFVWYLCKTISKIIKQKLSFSSVKCGKKRLVDTNKDLSDSILFREYCACFVFLKCLVPTFLTTSLSHYDTRRAFVELCGLLTHFTGCSAKVLQRRKVQMKSSDFTVGSPTNESIHKLQGRSHDTSQAKPA